MTRYLIVGLGLLLSACSDSREVAGYRLGASVREIREEAEGRGVRIFCPSDPGHDSVDLMLIVGPDSPMSGDLSRRQLCQAYDPAMTRHVALIFEDTTLFAIGLVRRDMLIPGAYAPGDPDVLSWDSLTAD